MAMKLKAVGLFVKDMATMAAFYRDVVGFVLEWDGVDPSVIIEHDGLRFLLFGRNDFEELTNQKYTYPSGTNGTFELALDVDTPEEVDKEYHRMVSKGALPITKPKTYPWGLRSCYVADPEGNLIEIATWKSENTWFVFKRWGVLRGIHMQNKRVLQAGIDKMEIEAKKCPYYGPLWETEYRSE